MKPENDFQLPAAVSALAAEGLLCFPCSRDKRPKTPHGYKDASADIETLRQMWRGCPGALIGVPTGALSDLDVLDVDARHGGGEWFGRNRHRLPLTRVHRTRSGGLHLLFRHRPGLRCSAGRIAAGVDVRSDGGYVIWWPAAGYPVLADRPMAPWPEWLRANANKIGAHHVRRVVVPDNTGLARLVRTVAAAHPGNRNSLTYWAACRAGEMVASGLLSGDSAAEVIAEAAVRAGLPLAEARRTARSGVRTAGRA